MLTKILGSQYFYVQSDGATAILTAYANAILQAAMHAAKENALSENADAHKVQYALQEKKERARHRMDVLEQENV